MQGSPSGWDYGSSLAYVRRLTHYWLEDFDWREAEAVLNSHFQHFKLHVNGVSLHFLHQQHGALCYISSTSTDQC